MLVVETTKSSGKGYIGLLSEPLIRLMMLIALTH